MKIDRKEFLSKTFRLILGVSALIFFKGFEPVLSKARLYNQENHMSQKTKFVHDWILNLMNSMDQNLEEKEKTRLLEDCGRACARSHAQKEAAKLRGDLDGWLGVMKKWVGPKNVQKEKNAVQVTYSQCYCPLVKDIPPLLSETYCHCSRGWLKEVFETVVEKPVEVKLEDSIMRGGKECRFTIFV
jgi:predicted hydrocarbon binding protein